MRSILSALFILVFSSICSQSVDKSSCYKLDFDHLIKFLIETHPDPYSAFGGQIDFFKSKQEAAKSIDSIKSDEEFALFVNSFLSRLDDGHTNINLPKSSSKTKFPIRFKIAADAIFVYATSDEYADLIGYKLVKINSKPIDYWAKKCKAFIQSENIYGEYFSLLNAISDSNISKKLFETEVLTLTLSDKQGKESQKDISYNENTKINYSKSKIEIEADNKLLYWSMIGEAGNVAYLSWNSIMCREMLQDTYKNRPDNINIYLNWAFGYLNEKPSGNVEDDIKKVPSLYEQIYLLFEEIAKRKAKYLIIDLRYNSGGSTPTVRPILYKIYGDKYLNYHFDTEMIKRISPLYLQKFGFNDIEEYNNSMGTALKLGDYIFASFGNLDKTKSLEQRREAIENGVEGFGTDFIKKTKQLDDIKIYILTSPSTFSAAYHFTYYLKELGRSTIIGVASRQAGNTFMETTSFSLPNTKLTGSISNSKQVLFKNDPEKGKVLRPDFEMKWKDYFYYSFDKNSEILKILDMIDSKSE